MYPNRSYYLSGLQHRDSSANEWGIPLIDEPLQAREGYHNYGNVGHCEEPNSFHAAQFPQQISSYPGSMSSSVPFASSAPRPLDQHSGAPLNLHQPISRSPDEYQSYDPRTLANHPAVQAPSRLETYTAQYIKDAQKKIQDRKVDMDRSWAESETINQELNSISKSLSLASDVASRHALQDKYETSKEKLKAVNQAFERKQRLLYSAEKKLEELSRGVPVACSVGDTQFFRVSGLAYASPSLASTPYQPLYTNHSNDFLAAPPALSLQSLNNSLSLPPTGLINASVLQLGSSPSDFPHQITSAVHSQPSNFPPDSSRPFTPLAASSRQNPNVTSPLSPNRQGVSKSKSKAPRRERKEIVPKEPKEGVLPKNATPEQFIKYSRWIQQLRAQQQAPTQWTGDDGKVCKDRALNSRLLGKILHANKVREQWKELHPDEWKHLKSEYGEDLEDRYERWSYRRIE